MNNKDIIQLQEDVSNSPLYSKDLAPVPPSERTWSMWNLAAIWVGMAVCIPTYILASYMIKTGVSWFAALLIIGLANLIITIPMVLNGHAGVKYGIPFPVLGRSSFGTNGIHIASVVRALVACGWFGIQTWIGGLAFYAIWMAITGGIPSPDLTVGKFIGFALFWLVNIYFVWNGTESIRWLEEWAAPILIFIGLALIGWGAYQAGGFGTVLEQGKQMQTPTAQVVQENGDFNLQLKPLKTKEGQFKASDYQLIIPTTTGEKTLSWQPLNEGELAAISLQNLATTQQFQLDKEGLQSGEKTVQVQFRKNLNGTEITSTKVAANLKQANNQGFGGTLWGYLLWLTAMVGFWATMSLSIADITRYAATQRAQVAGQFIGLPGTMILYSFVGIFVTFAALVNFEDILVTDDAPWDPVSLLTKFDSPIVVVISQIFMIIATLSTNIAANVIAPANAFSNLSPTKISFRIGGLITGIIGILICPWWLLNEISGFLIFVSGLLGPVLGILLCDYYLIRNKNLQLAELYKTNGVYAYGGSGFNSAAMIALAIGVVVALIGYWVPALDFLYKLSWFTGFLLSFAIYYFLMKRHVSLSS